MNEETVHTLRPQESLYEELADLGREPKARTRGLNSPPARPVPRGLDDEDLFFDGLAGENIGSQSVERSTASLLFRIRPSGCALCLLHAAVGTHAGWLEARVFFR